MGMEMPKFNPYNPEYKKVEDLPNNEQGNFKDIKGGFIKKTALEDIDEVRSDEDYLMESPEEQHTTLDKVYRCEELLGAEESEKIRTIVKSLKEPIEKMVMPVLENIKNGGYQLLIGDDASGRIPTLIVRKLINEVLHRKSKANIVTSFIAGTSMHDDSSDSIERYKTKIIKSYISNVKDKTPDEINSALIVTEFINTGFGLVPLTKALQENNINPTFLTVVLSESLAKGKKQGNLRPAQGINKLGGIVHYGYESIGSPSIYKNRHLGGVSKHISSLHAIPVRHALPDNEKELVMAKMTIARDEANKVADKLIAELLEQQ